MRIIVAGMVAGDPHQGGATWAVLQYVLGLQQLGHDVVLVEPVATLEAGSVAYFHDVVERFDLHGSAALLDGRRVTVGMTYTQLWDAARSADVLLNIAGMLEDPALLEGPAVRAYLDLDPAFTQLWHAAQGIDMRFDGHDVFLTLGSNIGTPASPIPTCGRAWRPTLPPVVLDRWPPVEAEPALPFTTVANWRGYGSVEWEGVHHGQKAHSLRPMFDLPQRVDGPFRIALTIHPDERPDVLALDAHGWQRNDPVNAAGTPDRYQQFVQRSTGELGIAKSGYVLSRSGWFSDRSACYLASGRPVIAQDTGFGAHLPTGEGLFAFTDVDDVATAVDAIRSDYPRHRRAARSIAEEVLDSRSVLERLLEVVSP